MTFDPHNPTGEPPFPGKLGALPSQHDPRTLNMATYMPADMAAPPAAVDWTSRASGWRMLGNDRMGDCEVVTAANLMQVWTSANTDTGEVKVGQADVVKAYTALTGYNPRTGEPDPGVRTLDMLNYWRKTGVGKRRIEAFVRLDHRDLGQVRTAANLFGGLFCAFALPRSAGTQFNRGQAWDVTSMSAGGVRGSWGGHAVAVPAYDPDGFEAITWARKQRMTLAFWRAYVSEAWAVVSPDWVGTDAINPLGFNLDHLRTDLAQIKNVRTV